ncbi:MAG: hypothetical protein KGL58_04980, partial [Pseudomonadota bacterium]|nr:hypothetical protein [Pseudomonadota bacterium]
YGALRPNESLLDAQWCLVDEEALKKEEEEIVIQVNGRLRGRITIPVNATREWVESRAESDSQVERFLAGKKIRKVVFVPHRLVNIVLENE